MKSIFLIFTFLVSTASATDSKCAASLQALTSADSSLVKAASYISFLVKQKFLTKNSLEKILASTTLLTIEDFDLMNANESQKLSLKHGLVAALKLIPSNERWNIVVLEIKKELLKHEVEKEKVNSVKADSKPIWIVPKEIDPLSLGIKPGDYQGSVVRPSGLDSLLLPLVFKTPDGFFNTKTKTLIPSHGLEPYRSTLIRYPQPNSEDFAIIGLTNGKDAPIKFKILSSSGDVLYDLDVKDKTINPDLVSSFFFISDVITFRHRVFAEYDEGKLIVELKSEENRYALLALEADLNKAGFKLIPADFQKEQQSEKYRVAAKKAVSYSGYKGTSQLLVRAGDLAYGVSTFYFPPPSRDKIEIYDINQGIIIDNIQWPEASRNFVGIASAALSTKDEKAIYIVSNESNGSMAILKIDLETKKAIILDKTFIKDDRVSTEVITPENSKPIIFAATGNAIYIYNAETGITHSVPHQSGDHKFTYLGYSHSSQEMLIYLTDRSRDGDIRVFKVYGAAD